MNILIVDDEWVSRAKMKKIMGRYGACTEATTGVQALDMIAAAAAAGRPFELMTLDVDMPHMSGLEVLARVRAMEQAAAGQIAAAPMKIVMVTAKGDRQTLSRSLFSGCDDYIIKPFQPDAIDRQMRILGISPLTV